MEQLGNLENVPLEYNENAPPSHDLRYRFLTQPLNFSRLHGLPTAQPQTQ
jgi:hypothetical protein